MINPFEKRATEFLRDAEGFLSLVTPEPLEAFLKKPAKEDRLYDRLVTIVGSPGSGKTTLATLMEFNAVNTLLKNLDTPLRRPLISALDSCNVIKNQLPLILGVRIPLEAGYRELWEFPYKADLKNGLLGSLLQARAVLGWLRNLNQAGINDEDITITYKPDSEAAIELIGGADATHLRDRARDVERSIYKISASLVPPDEKTIDPSATGPYKPFDVIRKITIRNFQNRGEVDLKPLIMLDDVHILAKDQLLFLKAWLAGREIEIARWMLTRVDALSPVEVLSDVEKISPVREQAAPSEDRDITKINFQALRGTRRERNSFRKMASDMAGRYFRHMPVFDRRQIHELQGFLDGSPPALTKNQSKELKNQIEKLVSEYKLSNKIVNDLKEKVQKYTQRAKNIDIGEDVQLAVNRILINRYLNRVKQSDLFADEVDVEPSKPLKVSSSVIDGARLQLYHQFGRPYYYGMNVICDVSDENAELFLRYAGKLVTHAETRLIRGKTASITVQDQNKLLVQRANEIMNDWAFPEVHAVKNLIKLIGARCVTKTLEPNASLGGGANAFGIPSDEFRKLIEDKPKIARLLQYAVGYSALVVVPDYDTKNRSWHLIELGGASKLFFGLTLAHGGFIESTASELEELINGGVDDL